jgi:DNA replication and repair protein RecF
LHIERIVIENLRNIAYADISPYNKLNIIFGSNGAGKTTLLESIYLLARARSFRQIKAGSLIKEGNEKLNLYTTLRTENQSKHKIGLQKSASGTIIKKDGELLKKLSSLAKAIPLSIISPNIQRIIEEDPQQRRRLLNWGLFHVEPNYGNLANRYKKILLQRNNALKDSYEQIKVWDQQLVKVGEEIDSTMFEYCKKWNQKINALVEKTQLIEPISICLKKGWKEDESFYEALERNGRIDRERGFTSCGPHRSDIRILQNGKQIRNRFSRGEAKITAVLLLLAQTKILSEFSDELPILLADDLHAELDSDRYSTLINLIEELKLQSFVTTLNFDHTTKDLITDSYQLFHVEQGVISKI